MPIWEEIDFPDHKGDPAIELDNILKIIKEDVNFEVCLEGLGFFQETFLMFIKINLQKKFLVDLMYFI